MNYTNYYKLRKPLSNEYYTIDDNNENVEIIDRELSRLSSQTRFVIAQRNRNPALPDYGMGEAVTLKTAPYSGGAEIALQVERNLYDAENMTAQPQSAPSGTIIIRKVED